MNDSRETISTQDPSEVQRKPVTGLPYDLDRLRVVASAMAGRPLAVERTDKDGLGYTDGRTVYVSPTTKPCELSTFLTVQCALLSAGSLEPRLMKQMAGRASVARRYLSVEAWRALAELAERLPPLPIVAAANRMEHLSSCPEQSMRIALGRQPLDDPPPVFGAIRPGRIRALAEAGKAPAVRTQHLPAELPADLPPEEDDEAEDTVPLGSLSRLLSGGIQTGLSRWLAKKFGGRSRPEDGDAGSEVPVGGAQALNQNRPKVRVCLIPTSLYPTEIDTKCGHGWRYPEWDTHADHYRSDWCTVTEFDPQVEGLAPLRSPRSTDLARRLSRLAVALERHRRQPQGEEIDLDAAIDGRVAARAGLTPPEAIYLETQRTRRSLSVLILIDVSGSAAERSAAGDVLRQQREAAAVLTEALNRLGDRVAVFGFRSRGRQAVSLLRIKEFEDHLDGSVYRRLGGLTPGGYTRLGASIRHAAHILDTRGGTERRLLLVLSDGIPYDDGYEGRYAESDAHRSLAEARRQGIGCLCLALGAGRPSEALQRVFGSAAHAAAPQLDDLVGDIGPLFYRAIASAEQQRRVARRQRHSPADRVKGAA